MGDRPTLAKGVGAMPHRRLISTVAIALASALTGPVDAAEVRTVHALAMHGSPKYPAGFKHLDHANPNAPKGGAITLAAIGTYDNLNPFVLKGVAAAGAGSIYDTLTTSTGDEAFTEYGLIAESIEVPDDRSWVAYTLRPEARFHDGKPITVDDVIFTLDTLKSKGHPFYRSYFADVAKAERVGERKVKFSFSGGENRELPLIVGQMSILPKHYWEGREFDKTTLEPPLGSGPYRIAQVDAGRSIVLQRVPDYWARDLPIRRGMHNIDTIRYDYYRDTTVSLEAFKSGSYDFRAENAAKDWATAYDFPAVKDGLVKKEAIKNEVPTGMQGFAFNLRRPMFQDPRVRQALTLMFDFEWSNKTLFYDAYARTKSYFSNSELASSGLPTGEELKILEPFRGKVPDEVFAKEYRPPVTDGSGNIREQTREALRLLREAGWEIKNQKLTNAKNEAFEFEILLSSPIWERISLPFAKNLERVGVVAKVRTVDTAQYQKRQDDFDFDMIVDVFGQSLSPGNEQRDFWHSAKAGIPGSRNTIGIKNPTVDALVDLVIAAPDREQLINRTRALDRVLLWGHYMIPNWHIQTWRIAYWDKFGRPDRFAKYSLGFPTTWWIDPAKAEALAKRRGG
jgi:microcin C transport system substrate-binding protein